MSEPEQYQLTVTRVASVETQEEYAARCADIANYAVARSAHLAQPDAPINFNDTTKFRKVSETAYELITPGYQQPETASERDTHFANFAEMLWEELHTLYLVEVPDEGHEAEKVRYEQMDKRIIAQRAYDLKAYILKDMPFCEAHLITDMPSFPEQEQ